MAFRLEAFVAEPPFPSIEDPTLPSPVEVSPEEAADRIRARIEHVAAEARKLFHGPAFSVFDLHLFTISESAGYILGERESSLGQPETVTLEPGALQDAALGVMAEHGFDPNRYTIVRRFSRDNGTFTETRTYTTDIRGMRFERNAYMTEADEPIEVSWSVGDRAPVINPFPNRNRRIVLA